MSLTKMLIIVFGLYLATGCDLLDNDDDDNSGTTSSASGDQLTLSLSGIEQQSGQHFEGWLIVDGSPVSTGRFNVNSDGDIVSVDTSGSVQSTISSDASNVVFSLAERVVGATAFVLTIEPDGDSDSAPSDSKLVAGSFSDATATATTENSSAIGTSFLDVTGQYILATPTNGSSTHNQGIWWLDGSTGTASLDLPELPDGWLYEGWVVSGGTPVSTGTFATPSGADSDGAGATAGTGSAPAFPGQDFITTARILNDGTYAAVISIEPDPDMDPAPFTLKILSDDIDSGAAVETLHDMTANSNEGDIGVTATLVDQ